MRHSLSHTMVWLRSGSDGVHVSPGWLGLPVRAKLAHAFAIFLASACVSGVLPVPCSQRLVLSKQKASSEVCHAPASSSMGDCHVKKYVYTGAAFRSCFSFAMRDTLLRPLTPPTPYESVRMLFSGCAFFMAAIKADALASPYCRAMVACHSSSVGRESILLPSSLTCLLYTSDAADDLLCVDLGGRRIIK